MTCILAGAPAAIRESLAEALADRYPGCPYAGAPSDKDILAAHQACGWPISLLHMPLRKVLASEELDDTPAVDSWHLAYAAGHVLKYLRLDLSTQRVLVIREGSAITFPLEERVSSLGVMAAAIVCRILDALGCPKDEKKHSHPITRAVRHVLRTFPMSAYAVLRDRSTLPPHLFHGPWTTLVPAIEATGFLAHGMELDGVWSARGGRITPWTGDTEAVMSIRWNIETSNEEGFTAARYVLATQLPSTYTVDKWPSELFAEAFPNVVDGWEPVLFDMAVVVSLLRREPTLTTELAREFPVYAFLPVNPAMSASSNQGKTAAMLLLARAMTPGIPPTLISDSPSAPDIRSQATVLREWRTMALDEFILPRQKTHFLRRESFQSLCTGAPVPVGVAMENKGSVQLAQSLCMSAKALDFPVDLINRTVSFYLRDLSEETRANGAMAAEVESGALALRIRLAAIAMCETYGIANLLSRMVHASSSTGFRFRVHRSVMALIHAIQSGCELPAAFVHTDTMVQHMHAFMAEHTAEAAQEGTLDNLRRGDLLRVSVAALFDEMSGQEAQDAQQYLLEHSTVTAGEHTLWGSAVVLLRSRAATFGLQDRPLMDVIGRTHGEKPRASDGQIVRAFMAEVRRISRGFEVFELSPTGGAQDEGWRVWVNLQHGRARFRWSKNPILAMTQGLE
jgi:hypothetical protein